MTAVATIRVFLPYHLRTLASISGEVELQVEGPITLRSVLDAHYTLARPEVVAEQKPKRSWQKRAMVIGGSSGAGAGIGALIGGKKGALIGAAIGGGAGTVYEMRK